MAINRRGNSRQHIVSFIQQFPPMQKEALSQAFASLLDLPASKQKQILPEVLRFVGSGTSPNKDVASKCNLSHEELVSFVLAARTLASFVGADESDEDIVAGLQEALDLTADTSAAIRTLLTLLREDKVALISLRDRQRLASETLPSFEGIHISVDIRLNVEEGKITNRVPVVLATISTDAPNQFISFQMTMEDLNDLKASLEKASSDAAVAEAWIDSTNNEEKAS